MNRLMRVLLSIFIADRAVNAEEIKNDKKNDNNQSEFTSDIELPPPLLQEVDLTGEYDPTKETCIIFSPLSDDVKFYNIYCSESQDDFLLNHSEFNIRDVTETIALLSGAGNELLILFNYLKADPLQYRLRIYKVQGYLVLGANLLDNHSNDWYYCTLLELPEGRFNPIILTVKKSPRDIEKQLLEHWADHTRPNDGGNK